MAGPERTERANRTLNRLSAAQVKGAPDGWHNDGGNLYLCVDGSRRRWIFRYMADGRRKEIGLGSATIVSLATTRTEAKKLRDVIAAGGDPLAERRKAEAEAEARKTFADVARKVIERDRAQWTEAHLKVWERSLFVLAKRLGPLDVGEIAVEHVQQTMAPIWDRDEHVSARHTLARIETVLGYAIARGWRTGANVAAWSVFKHLAPKRPDEIKHAAIPWSAAPAVMARLKSMDTTGARAVEFAILTAARISEAMGARWAEIDFDRATWSIPKGRMKMREPHIVPLSKQALDLLGDMHKHRTSEFVFPGQVDGTAIGRMQGWRVAKAVTEGRATTHGFRSTFRDWAADNGVEDRLAEQALAHKVQGVEASYLRTTVIERRRPVMQAWADYLEGIETDDANVVPFPSTAA